MENCRFLSRVPPEAVDDSRQGYPRWISDPVESQRAKCGLRRLVPGSNRSGFSEISLTKESAVKPVGRDRKFPSAFPLRPKNFLAQGASVVRPGPPRVVFFPV